MLLGKEYKKDAYIGLSYIIIGVLMGEYFSISAFFHKASIQNISNDVKNNFTKVKAYIWIVGNVFVITVLF